VKRLTEALNEPAARREATAALRGLIERVTLIPGPRRGEMDVLLTGELGTIRIPTVTTVL
jgi:site-specific DNA recombinase